MEPLIRPKFNVELSKNSQKLPYSECQVCPIDLIKHNELPQGGVWSEPKISSESKYIGAILSLNEKDYLYIWKKDTVSQPYFTYEDTKILSYEFASNNLSFVVIYETIGPIHYNIKSGKKIVNLQIPKLKMSKILAMSFSEQCRYFALGNETHFLIWDVLTGENKVTYKDGGLSKYIRNDAMVSIGKKGDVKIISMTSLKTIADFRIPRVALHTDILGCMLTEDKETFYYAEREMIYKTNIKKVNEEEVLYLEQTYPIKVFISSDCKKFMSTDMKQIDFWEEGTKGAIKSLPRQPFRHIAMNFNDTSLVLIDDISIIVADYSHYFEQTLIWTNLNPTNFKIVSYSAYGSIILTIFDDNNAAVWNSSTGRLIRKWYNPIKSWTYSLRLAPKTCENAIVAVKSSETLIEVWDCNKGITWLKLPGFNAFSTKFSHDGLMLLAGAFSGNDVAYLWTFSDKKNPKIFKNNDINIQTCVDISANNNFIICHSVNQNPEVFEVETTKSLFKCQGNCKFLEISELIISNDDNLFFSKGININNDPIAVLWNIDTGKIIKEFNNSTSIAFSGDSNYLVTNFVNPLNPEEDKVTLWSIDSNQVITSTSIAVNSTDNQFLSDSKVLSSRVVDKKMTRFVFTDVTTGAMIGEMKYIPEEKGMTHLDIGIEVDDNKTNVVLFKTTLADQ